MISSHNSAACPPKQELREFLLGCLSVASVDNLALHLESCPRCLGEVQALRVNDALLDRLRDSEHPVAPAPPDELQGLMRKLKQLSTSGPSVGVPRPHVPISEDTPSGSGADDDTDHLTSMPPMPERLLDRYRILRCIGMGGMGLVCEAEDEQLARRVAVKIPRFVGMTTGREKAQQRFLREIRLAAQVRHAHVCTIHDAGEDNGVPFVVMEQVNGQPLSAILQESGQFADCRQAARLAAQVARALEAVHAKGIIHRDLKPSNILINQQGEAILTDFGLALPSDSTSMLTAEGFTVGTPAYMSPEQVTAKAQVDARSDLYSLGLVLYQMTTGQLPFGGSVQEQVWQRLSSSAAAPSILRPDLDSDLDAIIMRAMARDADARFATAASMADALERWLARHQPVASPRSASTPWKTFAPWIGAAFLVTAAAIVIQWARSTASNEKGVMPPVSTGASAPHVVDAPVRFWTIGYVNRGVWSPTEKYAVLTTPFDAVLLSDVMGGATLHKLTGHGPTQLWALAVSPDGRFLLTGGDDRKVVFWDLDKRLAIQKYTGHEQAVKRVAFLPDKQRIASASDDQSIRIWDQATGEEVSKFDVQAEYPTVNSSTFSGDGRWFMNGRQDGHLELYEIPSGKLVKRWQPFKAAINTVDFSRDGKQVLVGGDGKQLQVWDIENQKLVADLEGHEQAPFLSVFAPGKRIVLSGERGGTICVWDLDSQRIIQRWLKHRFNLSALQAAPDGEHVLSMSGHGELALWKFTTP